MVALTASAPLKQLSLYIGIHRHKASSSGSESYESILRAIAEELKENVMHFPLTIIYLSLRWCGYAFKLFEHILQEKSYLPELLVWNTNI